jgi:HK97 family phage portal protein
MSLKERFQTSLETYWATGSKAAAAGSFIYPSSMRFSGKGNFMSIAPRNFPYYNTEPLTNSAVVNTLAWIQRNFGQARLQLEQTKIVKGKEQETEITEHPFLDLLNDPNPHYGYHALWAATLLSYHLDGNAYWIKVRNARGMGFPTALWYEPHWSIKPHYPSDGSAFIDYYQRTINGQTQQIPPENIVHFRNGLNPANPRYGLAPLKASLLQIYTDEEVSMWVAALCRNMAIPGVVISPEQSISLGKNSEKAEQIKQTWKRKFGGDNRGEPLILDFKGTISTLGFNPSDMDFTAISNKAESRISGAMGVPAIVAGLSVGMDASTYNNLANLKKSAFEECLEPCWESFECDLERQLLPDFTKDPSICVEFETKHIRALQENETERQDRERKNFECGAMTLNEFRQCINLEPDPQGDYYLRPTKAREISPEKAAQNSTEDPPVPTVQPADPPADPKPKKSKHLHKSIQWEGLELYREPTDLEKACLKAIAETLDQGKATMVSALTEMRKGLIDQASAEILKLEPADYHLLALHATKQQKDQIQGLVDAAYKKGRRLVKQELDYQRRMQGKATPEDLIDEEDYADLLEIATATIGRLLNELAARAIEIAGRLLMLLGKDKMEAAFRKELEDTSEGYISNIAAGAVNAAVADGRKREWEYNKDEVDHVIYSCVLDANSCDPCASADGMTAEDISGIPDTPNPDCSGGPLCRCLVIFVLKSENQPA